MTYSDRMWIGLSCLIACTGCPSDDGTEDGASGASVSDGTDSDVSPGSSSSTSSGDTATTSTTTSSTSTPAETTTGSDTEPATGTAGSESGESDSDTDPATDSGSSSSCINEQIELTGVVLDITTNQALGEDVAATFDQAQGSVACFSLDRMQLTLDYGPFDAGPRSRLILEVLDGARTYDLAVDPGAPASGETGLIGLSYALADGPATYGFSTLNQAATGTVDVASLPVDGSLSLEFDAVGEIAAPDGWSFDMHFEGTIPR